MKKQKTTNASLDGRVCIITGANSGVGYQGSLQLAQHGAHLVMVCRNKEKGEAAKAGIEEAARGPVDLVLGDLASLDGVRGLARTLLERYPQIHVLVNNAGVFYTRRTTTVDGFETVFAVNYLAMFLLTRLLVERIKACAPARIVNVASKGHQFGGLNLHDLHWEKRKYRAMKGYGASKTANILFVREMAERLKNTGVTFNCFHPGEVVTNIGVENNGKVYNLIKKVILDRVYWTPPSLAGEALYYLAASPELDNVTGEYFELTKLETPSAEARDRSLGRTLWLISEQFTGLVAPTHTV
jgi:NAD(P)-dependent dehydrogenase (short-subunit alcohol dehydrogenase family)